ncbi:MAG: hypothetical protein GXP44_00135 [bacterium]|nr:hypothetical protein [bacterium]
MNRLQKYFSVILLAGFLISPAFGFASEPPKPAEPAAPPTVTLFHGEECPHCLAEREFLKDLKKEIPGLEVVEYEVWHDEKNRKLFLDTAKKLNIKGLAVPLTIVGDQYLIGFDKPENSGEKIRRMIENLETGTASLGASGEGESVNLPFLGEVKIESLSLPLLSVVLGTLDGFNPCSMWALLVLLTLVIATGSRKKVWLVGGVFILTSAVSYFLFMAAWLNAFIFLGYLSFVQFAIGAAAVVAGVISIREFYKFKPNVCEVSTPEQQKKLSERIKKVLRSASLPMMLLGVVAIAFSVNLVELLCSLGIPVIFTKTLTMYNLAAWKYYGYIGLYDFFYMLDDIIVLAIAGFSMKFFLFNSAYSRWSRLVAGVLMLTLGIIFLFKPELLMLGS